MTVSATDRAAIFEALVIKTNQDSDQKEAKKLLLLQNWVGFSLSSQYPESFMKNVMLIQTTLHTYKTAPFFEYMPSVLRPKSVRLTVISGINRIYSILKIQHLNL